MQATRYEFKYLVSERTARQLRRMIHVYPTPDASTKGEGYPVRSQYLASPDLILCQQTACGEKNRFNLRVRAYGDNKSQPVFLAVKRRVTVAVLKKRATVFREAFDELLKSFTPDGAMLSERDERNIDALKYFCHLANQINARPAA